MNILQKRVIPQQLYNFVKLLKFKNEPVELLGTAGLASQQYFSDYDFFSQIMNKYNKKTVIKEINRILNDTKFDRDIYFIEGKIQTISGDKIRFYEEKQFNISNKLKIRDIEFIKLDFVIVVDNLMTELSIIYRFNKEEQPIENIKKSVKDDLKELLKDNQYYKVIKRIFTIIKLSTDEDKEIKLVKISRFLNTNVGKLYQLNSHLKAILLLLKNYNDEQTIKRVLVSLKDLGLKPNINKITNIIQQNEKIINEKGKKFYNKIKKLIK